MGATFNIDVNYAVYQSHSCPFTILLLREATILLSLHSNAFEELEERDAASTPSHCSDILRAPKIASMSSGPYLQVSTPKLLASIPIPLGFDPSTFRFRRPFPQTSIPIS